MSKQKIAIFSGGTMIHIRPHLSLCAPAYGTIGEELTTLLDQDHECVLYRSKMAGGYAFETNDDLEELIEKVLQDDDLTVIIMAAAVCDFEPTEVNINGMIGTGFGKEYARLDSRDEISINFKPTAKIINQIKEKRPDITLVTFKTTAGASIDEIKYKCLRNRDHSNADFVFGNDIQNYTNSLTDKDGFSVSSDRDENIKRLVDRIGEL